jgi:choline dehydrogenase-like flavoprotein
MITDIEHRTGAALDADVCVVGAGPAGILVALALAAKGIRTLLLESGGAGLEPGIQDLNKVLQTAKPNEGVSGSRFRALGGTTTRWGGQVLPFFGIDFEARPWLDLPAWPVTRAELEPHYEAALTFLGIQDSIRDPATVWRRGGLAEPDYGPALKPFLSSWCRIPDMGVVHRGAIEAARDLECVLNATVTALDYAEGRIAGLTAQDLRGNRMQVTARHFVFATGAVEAARLLLQPLADGGEGPWTRSGILGAYFQDHPGGVAAELRPTKGSPLHREVLTFWINGIKYQPRIRLSEEAQAAQQTLNVGGGIMPQTADPELLGSVRATLKSLLRGRIDREALGPVLRRPVRAALLSASQAWELFVRKRGFAAADMGYQLGLQLEQLPQRSNRITLSDERDALGQRRASLAWHISDAELRSALVYTEAVKESFERRGVATVTISEDLKQGDPAVVDRIIDQAHHMGTARMGRSIEEGVVDPDLKIFATDNGYVASSAVFPSGSFSNPTHTILAFAHRLAGHLAGQYGK